MPVSKLPLVDQYHPDDFRSSFHWRIWRIMAEFVDGWQFLGDYKKMVTFFGSARFKEGDHWYDEARKLGRELALLGFDIVTGGGPGLMEAANLGHQVGTPGSNNHAHSIGLPIKLPFEEHINKYLDIEKKFNRFSNRLLL